MAGPVAVMRWSTENIVQVLARTVLFADLSASELSIVAERTVPLEYGPGEIVYVMGEEPQGIYIVAEGSVRSVRQAVDGREQVLSVEYPCSTIGEVAVFDRGRCFSTAIAHGPTYLLFIRKSDMYRLYSDCPTLFGRSVELLANRVRDYAELVHTLSLHEVDRRVAWYVVKESERRGVSTDAGVALELTATHHDIACCIGCVREMVTRAFAHLQKAGLLQMKGRLVTIPNEADLAAYVAAGLPPHVRNRPPV